MIPLGHIQAAGVVRLQEEKEASCTVTFISSSEDNRKASFLPGCSAAGQANKPYSKASELQGKPLTAPLQPAGGWKEGVLDLWCVAVGPRPRLGQQSALGFSCCSSLPMMHLSDLISI